MYVGVCLYIWGNYVSVCFNLTALIEVYNYVKNAWNSEYKKYFTLSTFIVITFSTHKYSHEVTLP